MISHALRRARNLGILLAISAGVFLANAAGLSQMLDDSLAELRFEAQERAPSGDIVLVDIDARSLAAVGLWPWPRHLHGDLVRQAAKLGAARVAFDIDFSAASSPGEDQAFADALAQTPIETFLAAFVQHDTSAGTHVRGSMPIDPILRNSWPAVVNVPLDGDGQVRRFPFAVDIGGEMITSMPAVLSGREAADGAFGIDYAIDAARLPRISYVDVLSNRLAPGSLAGKTLIVGATALELRDHFSVPVHGVVSGSTIIALATETLLRDGALRFLLVPWLLMAGLGCAGLLVIRLLPARAAIAVLVALGAAIELVALFLQTGRAVVLASADLQILLAGFMAWAFAREFDLRRLLLWVARTQAGNSQNVLERVLDEGFDGVVIIDHAQRITRINREARDLLECADAERLQDLPSQVVNDILASLDAFRRGTATDQRSPGSLRTGPKDEPQILEYSIAPFWLKAIHDVEGQVASNAAYVCLTVRDVTERQLAQERMRFMALHDSLTGLSNRRVLEDRLESVLAAPDTHGGMALFCFDLDRFKAVNDALGHFVGDQVLVETARRAEAALHPGALVARIGGDEFSVLLPAGCVTEAVNQAACLAAAIAAPFLIGGHRISIGTSIGVSWWSAATRGTATSLMRHADAALYRAKRSSVEQVVVFEPSMDEDRLARLDLERDLAEALDRGEFEVVYQPQVGLRSGEFVGAEALLRWKHPNKGFISPVRFIPVAEEMGLIHRLGAWVLDTACREAMAWPQPIKLAVNVSALQFETGDLVAAVRHALEASGLPPERLELEITESAFVGESERLKGIFDALLAVGVSFALDDFGTGYSSLGYLHRFPISKIKIDRSFVTGVPCDGHAMAVLRSVRALAEGLGIRTIAEGIETSDQAETLRILGCDDGQGYLFSKPIQGAALHRLLDETDPTPLRLLASA